MYNFNPTYSIGKADFGLSFIGTTKVYSQNDNKITLPGYVYVNAFASYQIAKGLALSATVSNIFDTLGYTEAEGTSFVDNSTNYMRARPITGRLSKMSLTYSF
jgi:outer membrane receptor protein involved in Fe transport